MLRCENKIYEIKQADWQRKCKDAKKVEQEYQITQGQVETSIASFIININHELDNSSDLIPESR